MPTLEFKITVPEGTTVNIVGLEGAVTTTTPEDAAERYWRDYLSDNTRKLLAAAVRLQEIRRPGFTLEDIADNLSITYESVRSYKQTLGRPSRRWKEDTGTPEPIQLRWNDYHVAARRDAHGLLFAGGHGRDGLDSRSELHGRADR
jgi:hypothetical protein